MVLKVCAAHFILALSVAGFEVASIAARSATKVAHESVVRRVAEGAETAEAITRKALQMNVDHKGAVIGETVVAAKRRVEQQQMRDTIEKDVVQRRVEQQQQRHQQHSSWHDVTTEPNLSLTPVVRTIHVRPTLPFMKSVHVFDGDAKEVEFVKPDRGHDEWLMTTSKLSQAARGDKDKRPMHVVMVVFLACAVGVIVFGVSSFLIWRKWQDYSLSHSSQGTCSKPRADADFQSSLVDSSPGTRSKPSVDVDMQQAGQQFAKQALDRSGLSMSGRSLLLKNARAEQATSKYLRYSDPEGVKERLERQGINIDIEEVTEWCKHAALSWAEK